MENKTFFEPLVLKVIFREKPVFPKLEVDLQEIKKVANELSALVKLGVKLKQILDGKTIEKPSDLQELSNFIGSELTIQDERSNVYAESRSYILFFVKSRYSNGDFTEHHKPMKLLFQGRALPQYDMVSSRKITTISFDNSNLEEVVMRIRVELETWLSEVYKKVRDKKKHMKDCKTAVFAISQD